MDDLARQLAEADQYIAEAEARISRLILLIGHGRRHRLSVRNAEELIRQFRRTLEDWRVRRSRILDDIERRQTKTSN